MGGGNLLSELLSQVSFYKKSTLFFLILLVVGFGGYEVYSRTNILHADTTPAMDNTGALTDSLSMTLNNQGELYVGNAKVSPQIFATSKTYRYRYQVINNPTSYIDILQVTLSLPQSGSDANVTHRFISNGGVSSVDSSFTSPTTIVYTATGIAPESQLSIEFEVPKNFVTPTFWFKVSQDLQEIPIITWVYIALGLLVFTFVLLLIVGSARFRHVSANSEKVENPPSRLSPALLEILLHGQLSSRGLAATFISLAIRGHIIIRQLSDKEFRFRRTLSSDRLEDFEEMLLSQIFGPTAEMVSSEEVNFMLAREVFSKRVSQSFALAYRKVNQLGFFYTNPLAHHLKYQIMSVIIFIFGLTGLLINLFLVPGVQFALLIWGAIIISSFIIYFFAIGLPPRTIYGDRELARWLAFKRYLTDRQPISYNAISHDQYMAYLPYAIVMNAEADWTRRYYEVPFAPPSWYISEDISTINQFTNSIFPLFGYLSHSLTLSVAPAQR